MSRNTGQIPSYRLHKPSGQGRVIIGGEHLYLGPYASPESTTSTPGLMAELGANRKPRANCESPPINLHRRIPFYPLFRMVQ